MTPRQTKIHAGAGSGSFTTDSLGNVWLGGDAFGANHINVDCYYIPNGGGDTVGGTLTWRGITLDQPVLPKAFVFAAVFSHSSVEVRTIIVEFGTRDDTFAFDYSSSVGFVGQEGTTPYPTAHVGVGWTTPTSGIAKSVLTPVAGNQVWIAIHALDKSGNASTPTTPVASALDSDWTVVFDDGVDAFYYRFGTSGPTAGTVPYTVSPGTVSGNILNRFLHVGAVSTTAECSGGGQIIVDADPADGQPFTGRSLSPRSWLTYDYDDASRGFSLDTLNHPDTFYGGRKLGNLISLGSVERALSGRDSPYKMGNGQAEVDDSSRLLSTLEATAGSEFWFNREITINLAPNASIALGQTPHTRFRGIVIGYPTAGLQRSIAFSSVLGSEFSPLDLDRTIPSRQIKDDFPDAPTDSLDTFVPIGMGIFPDRGTVGVPVTTGVENVVVTMQTGPAAVTGLTATWGSGAPGGTFGDYRDMGEGVLLFYQVCQRIGGVWSEPATTSVTTGAGGGHVDIAWTPSGSATAIQVAVSLRSDFLQFDCLTTELSGATTTTTDTTGGTRSGVNTLGIWTLGLRINEFYVVFAALDDGSFSLKGQSPDVIIAPAFPDRLYNADITWDAYVPPTGRTVTGYRIIRHRSYYSDWGPVYDWQDEVGAAVLTVADVGHGTAYYDSYVDNPLVQFPGGASSQDGVVIAIPAGKEVIGGTTYNRLVLFGHAIRDIDGIYKSRDVQGTGTTDAKPIYDAVAEAEYGSTWLAQGHSGWPFANDYVPYGTDNNWYTVIFTTIDPLPTSVIVRCCAMEDVGDSTGSTIDGAARQFFHLFQNFILPPAGEVWKSGAWLAPREFDDGTPVINSLAIDALEAIEVARIGRYYRGQIYLDQPITIRTLLERFFDSFGMRFGENHHGQLIAVHLDDFADLSSLTVLTDVREIVGDTRMDPRLTEMANTEIYDYGYRPAESKQFLRLNQQQEDDIAIGTDGDTTVSPAIPRTGNRGRVKSHTRQMFYVDDPTTADDVISRDLAFYKYPPRYVSITCGLQAVPVTLGSIVAVTDFQGIGSDGWTERPLWVLGIQDVYNDLNTPPTITLNCVDVLRVLSGFGLWADGTVPVWASSTEAEQVNNMYWADASDLMSDGAPAKMWG